MDEEIRALYLNAILGQAVEEPSGNFSLSTFKGPQYGP
jgi:hypothetical protein